MIPEWVQAITGAGAFVIGFIGLLAVYVQISRARGEAQIAYDRQNIERVRVKKHETLDFARTTLDFRYSTWSELADDFSAEEVALMIERAYVDESSGPDHDGSSSLNKALEYLGLLETFAIGIFQEVYDAETAYQLYASRLIAVFQNYEPLILRRRADSGRDTLYRWLEELADIFAAHRSAQHGSFNSCDCLLARPPALQAGEVPNGASPRSGFDIAPGAGVYAQIRGNWQPAVAVSCSDTSVLVEFALGPRPVDQRQRLVNVKRIRIAQRNPRS